jgi:NAD kinase
LCKAKPKYELATSQSEEHDARCINVVIVSAMPIDDKPVVLVSDKPVEVKPLLDERKNIAACSIVCVDKGVQTDAPCVDRVSVQIP